MKYMTFLCLLLGALSLQAQKAIVVSGGDISDPNASVSYSIGQLAYSSYSEDNGLFIQGVQQPFEIFTEQTLDVPDLPEITMSFTVYPNPTSDSVNLSISNLTSLQASYSLYDIQSRQLISAAITTKDSRISMLNYPTGTYFLKVIDAGRSLKTFKIIKN